MHVSKSAIHGEKGCSLESQPLLLSLIRPESRVSRSSKRQLCVMSKAICLILLWTVVVGSVHFLIMGVSIGGLLGLELIPDDPSLTIVMVYFFVAVISVSYPVNGFLADVYFGRRNVIFASLWLILFFVAVLLLVVLPIAYSSHFSTTTFVVSCLGFVIAIIGIAGYGANFIQFGLDQLLDAPSYHQALFVHWAKWCYECLSAILLVIFGLDYCISNSSWVYKWTIIFSLVVTSTCILLSLTAFGCWKHHWFYTESRCQNPYKVVAKVLTFVFKHNHPLQRSAFTYCDDERPSRLDFAKERFGGPFSTEQVEDVKILLRIMLILLAIGPVFSVDFLIDNLSLGFIGIHVELVQDIEHCPWDLFVTNAGVLRYTMAATFFPAYIWIIFSLFRSRVPRMLTRIGFGMGLYIIGILSLLAVDTIGHFIEGKTNATGCILSVYHVDSFPEIPSLGMHWTVMIPSAILLAIGPTLLTATVFEFVSAQSPHTMKGFLFGVFFAIRGTFQFFGSLAASLFSSPRIWDDFVHHPLAVSCLSRSILFLTIVVLVSFVLFLIVARKYKQRERSDRPYDQRFVVDFYSRVIENRERDI